MSEKLCGAKLRRTEMVLNFFFFGGGEFPPANLSAECGENRGAKGAESSGDGCPPSRIWSLTGSGAYFDF